MVPSPISIIAACSAIAVQAIPVHHGTGDPPRSQRNTVEQFIETARVACFEKGSHRDALRALAADQHWNPVGESDLSHQNTEISDMIGGWTFQTPVGAVAILHSSLRAPLHGYVCSVTTKIKSRTQHREAKDLIASTFDAAIAEERDDPDRHTDRYWFDRGRAPPVKASLIYDRVRQSITLRMIHGTARPLGT